MEHLIEGSAPLRLCLDNSEEKIYICYSSHYGYCTNVLTPSMKSSINWHLLNKDILFMSCQRSAIKQVNDWALGMLYITNHTMGVIHKSTVGVFTFTFLITPLQKKVLYFSRIIILSQRLIFK